MALTATVHRVEIALSDVDRGVYETLDLRLAQHPSESVRYLLTRTLAYCLSYEEGIAFSKGGVSSADEPPISIRDATGLLVAWIDVGTPSAERLHRASKAASRVALFTHAELAQLRREAATRPIHNRLPGRARRADGPEHAARADAQRRAALHRRRRGDPGDAARPRVARRARPGEPTVMTFHPA
jgi:hypothetical protein